MVPNSDDYAHADTFTQAVTQMRRPRAAHLPPHLELLGVNLDNTAISDAAAVGDLVGTLTVLTGETTKTDVPTETYTVTMTDDAGDNFALDGMAVVVAGTMVEGSYPIVIHTVADVSGQAVDTSFTIVVTVAASRGKK